MPKITSFTIQLLIYASLALLLGPISPAAAQTTEDVFIYLPLVVKGNGEVPSPEEYLGEKVPVQGANTFFKDSIFNSTRELAIWIPPNADVVRGILFHNGAPNKPNPSDPDWRNEVAQTREWASRQLAWMWGFAYISGTVWADDRRGFTDQEEFFHNALEEFIQQTGHPELRYAPLAIHGESRTSAFGAEYGQKYPERVIGYVIVVAGNPVVAPGVPGLMLVGEENKGEELAQGSFMRDRGQGALLAVAMMWDIDHRCGHCGDLAWLFFDQLVRLRVPEDADPSQGPVQLKPLIESEGWLGDVDNWGAVYPYDQYPGDKSRAAWLPNAYLAHLWRGFVITDPPPATMSWPTQPYKWSNGFTQQPAPLFGKDKREISSAKSIDLVATLSQPLTGQFHFYDGDIDLGPGAPSADGKKVELKGIRLEAGMHSFILVKDNQIISRPAGLIVLDER